MINHRFIRRLGTNYELFRIASSYHSRISLRLRRNIEPEENNKNECMKETLLDFQGTW